ncbi:phosphate ABC transporter substrate-binding protein [Halobacteriales archaeon QS_9_68_17]|nr:MAG: phosphate ABC transporter substrate-binding protein [Halobacteriales archaeon QS_9_68_17]
MTDRRSFLKGVGVAGGVAFTAGCIGSFGSQPYGDGTLTFVMSPTEPQEYMESQYAPVRDYLNEQTEDDVDVELQYANNYSAVLRALGEGNAEIAETGPFAAALGVRGDQCDVILQRFAYGSWDYHSVIVTNEDSDIEEPADLEGGDIGFAATTSASGSLYPLYMLKQAGLETGDAPMGDEGADFNASWSGHAQAFEALQSGQVDAAGVGRFITWDYGNEDYVEGVREVDSVSGIPRAPIIVSPELDDEKRGMFTEAFLDAPDDMYFGKDGEEDGDDEENPDDLWFSDVREADVDTYQPVVDVANELGIESDLLDQGAE